MKYCGCMPAGTGNHEEDSAALRPKLTPPSSRYEPSKVKKSSEVWKARINTTLRLSGCSGVSSSARETCGAGVVCLYVHIALSDIDHIQQIVSIHHLAGIHRRECSTTGCPQIGDSVLILIENSLLRNQWNGSAGTESQRRLRGHDRKSTPNKQSEPRRHSSAYSYCLLLLLLYNCWMQTSTFTFTSHFTSMKREGIPYY